MRRQSPAAPFPRWSSFLTSDSASNATRQEGEGESKEEIPEHRCTKAELAERWWGTESANALRERAAVDLTLSADGSEVFRYGDLIDWMESHRTEIHQWGEDYDPTFSHSNLPQEDAALTARAGCKPSPIAAVF
jgi:hypothetical protein